MMKRFHNKGIIVALMLCLGLSLSCPVRGYAEGGEPVYITINQADLDVAEEPGIITLTSVGGEEHALAIALDNPTLKVATMSLEVCTEDSDLTLAGCDTTDRTDGFLCRSRVSGNGCCSVTLFSMNRLEVIAEGMGTIFILRYTRSEEAPQGTCTTFSPENTYITDDTGSAVEAVSSPGQYCFNSPSPSCEIGIHPETAEAATGEIIQFEALTSGTGCDPSCYAWQVTGTSGGNIDASGVYTAGTPGETDLINMIDACRGEIVAAAAVYVLEDADEDGIVDEADDCLASNLEDTITVYSCDSGVDNVLLDDGCSLNDLIAACDHTLKNHGLFVSCVARLTNGWKRHGWIRLQEKGAIQRCAAQSWRERIEARRGTVEE